MGLSNEANLPAEATNSAENTWFHGPHVHESRPKHPEGETPQGAIQARGLGRPWLSQAHPLICSFYRLRFLLEARVLLPVQYRLKAGREFQAVFSGGKSHADALIVLYTLPRSDEAVRFGFSMSRTFGGAVQRNRVKRLMSEAVCGLLPEVARGQDIVLVARGRARNAQLAEITASLERLLTKARARIGREEA